MIMLKNHIKIAWRNLLRHKTQSIINISGLAIGMAASVLIMLWVQNELTYDNYHQDSGQIYRITHELEKQDFHSEYSSYILAETAKEKLPEIEHAAILLPAENPPVFTFNGNPYRGDRTAHINPDWLAVFHYDFIAGSAASFLRGPHSLLITESIAAKYFGKAEPLGKVITIDSVDYRVQAVVKDNPPNSSFQFDVLIPVSDLLNNPKNARRLTGWGVGSCLTFLKLRKSTNLNVAENKLTDIFRKNFQWGKDSKFSLLPLKDLHFEKLDSSNVDHGKKSMVTIFSVLAILLLFIACINYVNLVTAKASLRTKEVSVRKISGAERSELFSQFLVETMVTAGIALFFCNTYYRNLRAIF